MKPNKPYLIVAVILAGLGWSGMAQPAMAASSQPVVGFTIHVHNDARLNRQTLTEAEQTATKVFHNAGVEAHWVDDPETWGPAQENSDDPSPVSLADLRLTILSRTMADRFALAGDVMGLAPGAGPNRLMVYVACGRVDEWAQAQLNSMMGTLDRRPALGQFLGAAIAHEVGHVLLDLPSHSKAGIMRARWDSQDLRDLADGSLRFTSIQEQVIRAEVARRVGASVAPFAQN